MRKSLPIADGRRFGCTRCGKCCMEPGYVYMSGAELARMAAHLGISEGTFKRRYDVRYERSHDEWVIEALDGRGCPLLEGGRCSVHPVKPRQCATFPFWEDMLDDARRWEEAKRFCAGLDAPDGELYSEARIAAIKAGWSTT